MTRITFLAIALVALSVTPAMADKETDTQHMLPSTSIDGDGSIDGIREADASPRLNF